MFIGRACIGASPVTSGCAADVLSVVVPGEYVPAHAIGQHLMHTVLRFSPSRPPQRRHET